MSTNKAHTILLVNPPRPLRHLLRWSMAAQMANVKLTVGTLEEVIAQIGMVVGLLALGFRTGGERSGTAAWENEMD